MSDPALVPLADNLVIEEQGPGAFEAVLGGYDGQTFGGQTLGLAARALALAAPDRELSALYATFQRPLPPDVPVRFRVDALRDGRRLCQRRVTAEHRGKVLFEATATLATPGQGPAFHDPPIEAFGEPESVPEVAEDREGWAGVAIDWRFEGRPWTAAPGETSRWSAWVRPGDTLAREPGLHEGALLFLSDFGSHWSVERRLPGDSDVPRVLSLDHAVWLYGPVVWDDWWLMTSEARAAHDGRPLTRREISDRHGRPVATVMQQGLIVEPA